MIKQGKTGRPFFVGYGNKVHKEIASIVYPAFALFACGMVVLALVLSSSQGDPGDGRFRGDLGYQTRTGLLEFHPYPVLRIPAKDGVPPTTLMMSGQGKRGVMQQGEALKGQMVDAGGILLTRGDIKMLQIGGKVRLRPTENQELPAFSPAPAKGLGRWRLTGEICDGKCYAGAMRPGTGLAHKACANLCLIGGVPAVFVSTSEVEGSRFFLLADGDGNVLDEQLYDLTALMIEVEGEVERLDDLNVLRIDPETVRLLR